MSETAPAPAPSAGAEPHPLRAVVHAGGLTFEREVSLSSGTQVWEELARAGLDAEIRDADADLLPGLAASPADAVFIALHGATGEDGALRAVGRGDSDAGRMVGPANSDTYEDGR